MSELGMLLVETGQFAGGLKRLSQAYSSCQRLLPSHHPIAFRVYSNLIVCCKIIESRSPATIREHLPQFRDLQSQALAQLSEINQADTEDRINEMRLAIKRGRETSLLDQKIMHFDQATEILEALACFRESRWYAMYIALMLADALSVEGDVHQAAALLDKAEDICAKEQIFNGWRLVRINIVKIRLFARQEQTSEAH
jgi:hypothetical protein